MRINQISVFLENTKGRLADVCALLGKNDIDIRALTVAESQDFGVLRMVVDRPQEALNLLKDNGFTANFTEIVAVEICDSPGGLSDVLQVLKKNKVNVEYMYGFVEKSSDKALMVFRFDDIDRAIEVFSKNKIKVVKKDQIIKI